MNPHYVLDDFWPHAPATSSASRVTPHSEPARAEPARAFKEIQLVLLALVVLCITAVGAFYSCGPSLATRESIEMPASAQFSRTAQLDERDALPRILDSDRRLQTRQRGER